MERYYQHSQRKWDTLTSLMHPQILVSKGWVEVTEDEYKRIRRNNEKQNKASGL